MLNYYLTIVLAPLAEVWPGVLVPGHGQVEVLLRSVSGQAAEIVARPEEWGASAPLS